MSSMGGSRVKNLNSAELDLSLTGSQLSVHSTSSSRPASSRHHQHPPSPSSRHQPASPSSRPSPAKHSPGGSASGVRSGGTAAANKRQSPVPRGKIVNGDAGIKDHRSTPRRRSSLTSPASSSRSDRHTPATNHHNTPAGGGDTDEFLALFEQRTEPKILKPKQNLKTKPDNSQGARKKTYANSTEHSDSATSPRAAGGGGTTDRSHTTNVFRPPTTVRSSYSDLADDDVARQYTTQHVGEDDAGDQHDGYLSRSHNNRSSSSPDNHRTDGLSSTYRLNQSHTSATLGLPDGSIANNMTSQARSPSTKASLMDLENSYQNIKHKMPVNQRVKSRQTPPLNTQRTNHSAASRHMAAVRIQRWYRRHCVRKKAGDAALRRLLDKTRAEHSRDEDGAAGGSSMRGDYLRQSVEKSAEERKAIREEKAKRARQEAIRELKLKREEKRVQNQVVAEEEVNRLKAAGKVGQRANNRAARSTSNQPQRGNDSGSVDKNNVHHSHNHNDSAAAAMRDRHSSERERAGSSGHLAAGGESESSSDRGSHRKLELSNRNVIDDIFQRNSPRAAKTTNTRPVHNRTRHQDRNDNEAGSGDDGSVPSYDHTISPPSLSPPRSDNDGDSPRAGDDTTRETEGGGITSSRATRTTIETLMDTLKKLEEEEKLPSGKKDKNQTPSNWLDDLEPRDDHDDYLTAENLARLNHPSPATHGGGGGAAPPHPNPSSSLHIDKDNVKRSGLLTDEKLRSIISFLDEVETADRLSEIDHTAANSTNGAPAGVQDTGVDPLSGGAGTAAAAVGAGLVPSASEIEEMERTAVVASQVTNTVLSQRLQLEEKQRSINMLQKALNQQRELTVRHTKQTEKDLSQQLTVQKDEYEQTITRHLSFIDQLIDDKKSLSEKCEGLVKELKTVDKKYSDRLKALQDKHDAELKKIKDVQAAAEKIRREKWIDEKTKKIKEMTVKGLEPEIQRLIAKHKAEIKKLKSIHEAELLASDERAGVRYVKMTEELRDQLAKEKEAACTRERELARQTYEKQMEQEEESYQSQRRRLYAEVREEKERLNNQAKRQRQELDRLQRQLEDNQATVTTAIKQEYEHGREQQEQRHKSEMTALKEQLMIERQAWEENYKKKQETWLTNKEREMREAVRKERDREIESVIERLENDTHTARDECERLADNRIKRIRDKYESEMAEVERSERLVTEKYNKTKASLAEMEGENERRKVILKQRDKEIVDLKKLLDRLNEERDRVSDVIRQEFTDRIVATEEENKRVKQDMAELKSKHRIEIERMKAEIERVERGKQEEMEEVHKRVKQAIVKKEEVVTQMKQQYQSAVKRADHLEGLLEQQRKQLLAAAGGTGGTATRKK